MSKFSDTAADDGTVDAILEGGPLDLPPAARKRRIEGSARKVKVPHRGGYEHFELVEESRQGSAGAVWRFRWTRRTKFAE